jgi:hypothetical protein
MTWYKKIAALGQNIQFVAFWAHLGVAALIVENLPHPLIALLTITFVACGKEFYFDAKYETNPPQTFLDNLEDLAGWFVGAVVGYILKEVVK